MASYDSTKKDGMHITKSFVAHLVQRALAEKEILNSSQHRPASQAHHDYSPGTCVSVHSSPSENLYGKVNKSCSEVDSHVQSLSFVPMRSSKFVPQKSECEKKARKKTTLSVSQVAVKVPVVNVVNSKQCKESSNPGCARLIQSNNQQQGIIQGSTELKELLEQKSESQISVISDKRNLTKLVSLISSALNLECADLDTLIRKLKHLQNQNIDASNSKTLAMINNAQRLTSEFLHKLTFDQPIAKQIGSGESFSKANSLNEKDNSVKKCTKAENTPRKSKKRPHSKDSEHERSPRRSSNKKSQNQSQHKTEKRESSKFASEKLSFNSSSPDEHISQPCKRIKTCITDSKTLLQDVVRGSAKARSQSNDISNKNTVAELKQLISSATNSRNADLDTHIRTIKLIHNQILNLPASENSASVLNSAQKLVSDLHLKLSADQSCGESFDKAFSLDVKDKQYSKTDNILEKSKKQSSSKDHRPSGDKDHRSVEDGRSSERCHEKSYDQKDHRPSVEHARSSERYHEKSYDQKDHRPSAEHGKNLEIGHERSYNQKDHRPLGEHGRSSERCHEKSYDKKDHRLSVEHGRTLERSREKSYEQKDHRPSVEHGRSLERGHEKNCDQKDHGPSVEHGRSSERDHEKSYDQSQCKTESGESSKSVSKMSSIRVSTEEDHTRKSRAKNTDCSEDQKVNTKYESHKNVNSKTVPEETSQPKKSTKRFCVPTKKVHDLRPKAQSSSKSSHYLQTSTFRSRRCSSSINFKETKKETHDEKKIKFVKGRSPARRNRTLPSVRNTDRHLSDKSSTKKKIPPLTDKPQSKPLTKSSSSHDGKSPSQSKSKQVISSSDSKSSSSVEEIAHSENIKSESCDISGNVITEEKKFDICSARQSTDGLPSAVHKSSDLNDALEPISDESLSGMSGNVVTEEKKFDIFSARQSTDGLPSAVHKSSDLNDALEPISDESLSGMSESDHFEKATGKTTHNQDVQIQSPIDPVLTALFKTIAAASVLFPGLLTSVPVQQAHTVQLSNQHSTLSMSQPNMVAEKCESKEKNQHNGVVLPTDYGKQQNFIKTHLSSLMNTVKVLDLELKKKVKVISPKCEAAPAKVIKPECHVTPAKKIESECYATCMKIKLERDADPVRKMTPEQGAAPVKVTSGNDAAPHKTVNAKESPNQQQHGFTYFDPGNHWCQCCNKVLDTVQDMLTHLKSAEHKKYIHTIHKPWVPKCVRKIITKEERNYHELCKPVKGVQFLVPTDGFYCSLCMQNFGDKTCAEDHLASDEHNAAYEILANITLKSASLQNKPVPHGSDQQKSNGRNCDVENRAGLHDVNTIHSVQSKTLTSFLVPSHQYGWLPFTCQWQLLYPHLGSLLPHQVYSDQMSPLPEMPQENTGQVVPPHSVQSPLYQCTPPTYQVLLPTMYQAPPPTHQASPSTSQASPPTPQVSTPTHQVSTLTHQVSTLTHQLLHQVPPTAHQVPPPAHQIPPPAHQVPPPAHQVPPPSFQVPPPSHHMSSPLHQVLPPSHQAPPPPVHPGLLDQQIPAPFQGHPHQGPHQSSSLSPQQKLAPGHQDLPPPQWQHPPPVLQDPPPPPPPWQQQNPAPPPPWQQQNPAPPPWQHPPPPQEPSLYQRHPSFHHSHPPFYKFTPPHVKVKNRCLKFLTQMAAKRKSKQ